MNKIINSVLIVGLCLSSIWAYKTGFDFEPLIAFFASISGLLIYNFTSIVKEKNKVKIKGKKNKLKQSSSGSNESEIEGDENEVIQN